MERHKKHIEGDFKSRLTSFCVNALHFVYACWQQTANHLGSSSFITNTTGYASQPPIAIGVQYLPFGEPKRLLAQSSRIPLKNISADEQTFVDQQNGYDSRYTFSAKEKDDETQYSYFGARYYDADLSVWLSVDPMAYKYPNLSPFAYCANNPVFYIDKDGRDIFIHGVDAQKTVDELQTRTSLTLSYDPETKQLTASGEAKTDYDRELLNASIDKGVQVNLITTTQDVVSVDGQDVGIDVGGYAGNIETTDAEGNTIVRTQQFFNYDQAKSESDDGGNSIGTNVFHEILESYIAGKESPNAKGPYGKNKSSENARAYLNAHYKANNLDPEFKERITVTKEDGTIKITYERKVYEIED